MGLKHTAIQHNGERQSNITWASDGVGDFFNDSCLVKFVYQNDTNRSPGQPSVDNSRYREPNTVESIVTAWPDKISALNKAIRIHVKIRIALHAFDALIKPERNGVCLIADNARKRYHRHNYAPN